MKEIAMTRQTLDKLTRYVDVARMLMLVEGQKGVYEKMSKLLNRLLYILADACVVGEAIHSPGLKVAITFDDSESFILGLSLQTIQGLLENFQNDDDVELDDLDIEVVKDFYKFVGMMADGTTEVKDGLDFCVG